MSLMSHDHGPVDKKGPIGWMAAHPVAANLLMFVLVIGGILFALGVKREVFPEIEMDMVTVVVAYPGASPQEVEEGVVLSIEDEISSLDGIKKINSISVEGVGTVMAELLTSANPDRTYNDIKSTVDRITSFPQDAERPVISLVTNRRQVLSLLVHGDVDLKSLDRLAEELRSELLSDERITLVEKTGIPPPEISVEVPSDNLRRYGLTLPQISTAVRAASIDLPGGAVKTSGGEVLVRTTERRDFGEEFRDITLIARADGTRVRLRDVATVVDGFRETDEELYYNGQPAIDLQVYRVGEEVPLQVSSAVYDLVERRQGTLPDSVGIAIVNDESEDYRDRLSILGKNGLIGLLLVVTVLGIFLRPAVAFWVSLGIAISFCGSFFLIPMLGVSLNMISLFAFILVLGIAVDDAVVVGEAIFYHRRGDNRLEAAIVGTREVLVPVTFAVITTIIAFIPLALVPGITGKFFRNIPFIVIPVLLLSLIESVFILPAHLRHVGRTRLRGRKGRRRSLNPFKKLGALQLRFSEWVERVIAGQVPPIVRRLVRDRYLTVAVMFSALVIAVSVVAGGHIKFNFFPRIEGEFANGVIELPFGAPVADTREIARRVTRAAEEVGVELLAEGRMRPGRDGTIPDTVFRGIEAKIGTADTGAFGPGQGFAVTGGHVGVVTVHLVPDAEREFGSAEFTARWRDQVGEVSGVDRLSFDFNDGPSAGAKVSVQLEHTQTPPLEAAAARVAASLGTYNGVFDVDDGFKVGKPQLDLVLKPAAKGLGLTERALAAQVRGAFFGAEASRQQRGRDELRVYVRLPREERDSVHAIENLLIRTPGGGEIPLHQAAYVRPGRSFTEILRVDGRRTVTVTADIDPTATTGNDIRAALARTILPEVVADTPGLTFNFSGEQEAQAEAVASLSGNLVIAMLAMYALMAIAFRSYLQPLVVLSAVPFGMFGAVVGHLIMGYDLSFLSIFGLVALSGVVVNDSLVLIDAVNQLRAEGRSLIDAVVGGVTRRVRPVILTSLTTFFGLMPIILERSNQAQWLVPMALSLGFGVLFVTGIALILVPCTYMMVDDLKRGLRWMVFGSQSGEPEALPQPGGR
ncbi:MAG: efflux RND transporter permease subunit [Acidobacteria bacterium]|nr:efflux RND transporter permease subunit [Acidobacteriota bacterium]